MHTFLTVKTNALRRYPDNHYTLTSASNGNALCDACAASSECPMRNERKRCAQFVPVLRFAVNANLDLPLYNTIRIGKAWSDRLPVGTRVGVWDDVKRELSFSVVRENYWGQDKQLMLAAHAGRNHIGMTLDAPATDLAGVLANCYGKGFYAKSFGLSVLYLSPSL